MSHPELDALLFEPMKANMSVRAYNALASAGLYTLKQVRAADLTRVRNMGPKLRRFVQKRVAVAVAAITRAEAGGEMTHHVVDLYHAPTLGYELATAFEAEAEATGARLEGLEHDANEWSLFFQKVAARIIAAMPDAVSTRSGRRSPNGGE